MKRSLAWITAALTFSGAYAGHAKPTYVKKAQAAGYTEVQDCLYCHTKKTGRVLNDRGQFLHDKMKEAGLKDVDFQWLKEYKAPEGQEEQKPAEESKPTDAPEASK
jgi:hypothetical protein